ncbi:hypothetical protein Cni_G21745 [Canna indica]|uniref:Uncharacterized protein n=1 Tax=Canna indica TaxID=4628 RepID=A0AAQ3QKZ2_9LILI|nr:hypothetical protein Cni_G21745 [Canna indica]
MAKNRNKKGKKKDGAVSMDVSSEAVSDAPQPMDTTEGKTSSSALDRKGKKVVPMKRSKNVRKLKRIARAIVTSEKGEEKETKQKSKMLRVQSAKSLYD